MPSGYVPQSCTEIKRLWPKSTSGYYTIATESGQAKVVYCQMGRLCGSRGPWTRIAYLDMSNPMHKCPRTLREYGANGVRVCGRPVTRTGSCASVFFDSPGRPYSKVCGRVTGYQFYTPSAAQAQAGKSINTFYVDGVSLTKGSPQQHVWTFMAGLADRNLPLVYACPCAHRTSQKSPSFVGKDYFCEAGHPGFPGRPLKRVLITSDPLWDGKSCGPSEVPCCNVPGSPWFYKSFPKPSTDFLEMRVCCDQDTSDEDSPVGNYEIYVQ